MIIESIKIYNLKIPFSRTVKHSLFARDVTESIVVVLQDQNGNQGFGEGTPRSYVTGETLDQCLAAAKQIAGKIIDKSFETPHERDAMLQETRGQDPACPNPAASCALETALLDLLSRVAKQPLYQRFGRQRTPAHLVYSGVIPSTKHKSQFLQYLELIRKLKLSSIKLKVVDLESGLSQIKIAREKLGRAVAIRVDANAAFTAETALQFIGKATSFHLAAIEQPVPKNDLAGLKKVTVHSDVPIVADESMYTSQGPFYLIDNNICHGLNIRLSSCGGFHRACQIYQKANQKQMMIILGAHVGETAILSFAGRHLAMICEEAQYLEGSFSKYVLQEDLVDEEIAFGEGGMVPVPANIGLGVAIKNATLQKWSDLFASLSAADGRS